MSARRFYIRWKNAAGQERHYAEPQTPTATKNILRRILRKKPVKKTHAVEITVKEVAT